MSVSMRGIDRRCKPVKNTQYTESKLSRRRTIVCSAVYAACVNDISHTYNRRNVSVCIHTIAKPWNLNWLCGAVTQKWRGTNEKETKHAAITEWLQWFESMSYMIISCVSAMLLLLLLLLAYGTHTTFVFWLQLEIDSYFCQFSSVSAHSQYKRECAQRMSRLKLSPIPSAKNNKN